jgi:hypothetical protein
MKKDPKPSPTDYRLIADSSYIVLPDMKIARLLTPTIRGGVIYYNLFVPDYTRMSLADIEATLKAGEVTKATDPTTK